MKRDIVRMYLRNRRVKWGLVILTAFIFIFSAAALFALSFDDDKNNIAKAEGNASNSRTHRGQGNELINRSLGDDKRISQAEKDKADIARVKGSIVTVDPGHGGHDYGTGYEKLDEKDINLDISLKLGKLLSDAGITAIYTRQTDEFIPLRTRTDIANNAGAQLFISVHCNSLEDDTSCNGSETLYKDKDTETGKVDSKRFAEIVQGELIGALDMKDNGIIRRPGLAVLSHTKMPAVIAEVGYISNASDREKLISDEYKAKAAEALFKAAIKALNEMKQ